MFPQKQQPSFKFVIRSKLPTEPSSSDNKEADKESTTVTPPSEPTIATTVPEDTERKRKRSDRESVPLASKKVSFRGPIMETVFFCNMNLTDYALSGAQPATKVE